MAKGIYTYYKDRLVEISGKSKCLYLKSITKKCAYDIGRILQGRKDKVREFVSFLWSDNNQPLTLISTDESAEIIKNIDLPARSKKEPDVKGLSIPEAEAMQKKYEKNRDRDSQKALEAEVAKIVELKREVEELEKETGRYEFYIGYPFVFGSINQGQNKTLIKAPLMLFPVTVEIFDDCRVEISHNRKDKIQINRALVFAYAQSKRIDIRDLELDFDDLSQFKDVREVISYLNANRIKIATDTTPNIYDYPRYKEPEATSELSVRYAAVLARLSLSNSIYSDYTLLEKKRLTNDAITELLRNGTKRGKKSEKSIQKERKKRLKARRSVSNSCYTIKMPDFSQWEVVKKVDENGNMVIYGPPGTGKSQTIVNIITDAICKNKKILVVSQKKAALDVVYSRLGVLNEKAMYITDEKKDKKAFYERCFNAHQRDEKESLVSVELIEREYNELQERIDKETEVLERIHKFLTVKRPFGLSLSEMYSTSYIISKNTNDYQVYLKMTEDKPLMALRYKELADAIFAIEANSLHKMYYAFVEAKEKNPIIDTMRPDIDINTLGEVLSFVDEMQKSKKGFFDIKKYPYVRQVLAHYDRMGTKGDVRSIVKLECKLENPRSILRGNKERAMEAAFLETAAAIDEFVKEYDELNRVMTRDGYMAVVDNILRGNNSYLRLVREAIENYIEFRDMAKLMQTLDKPMLTVLNFAYVNCKNQSNYFDIIKKIPTFRKYHELTRYEEECRDDLALLVDFPNITSRIYKLKERQLEVSYKLCAGKKSLEYRKYYEEAPDAKDYLYQISKDKKLWPIRQTMEKYSDFILPLFPCFLLSPENVSAILPLKKNMFDLVIFDEASQVFIESTIPAIYRGKNIVVAGDAKQLRPSATFMKRYLAQDVEENEDEAIQAALEVDSLLDLAVARYESANLNYHYRSRHEELISFSNTVFYSSNLQVAPNISTNKNSRPIERYKVNGRWVDRCNPVEAEKVVDILRDIFKKRKNNESIGIITFNSEQQSCIADRIDEVSRTDGEFRAFMAKERYRQDNGEDTGIFIKNLENVQGDERDIIIFSIGYAPNEQGRIYTNFGSLSGEGGENRLNVAVTRAKSKIIIVTSIEPEDLKVDTAKNSGPKLLREYLAYTRAVSEGDVAHARDVLRGLDHGDDGHTSGDGTKSPAALELKAALEKKGYTVHLDLGNRNNRISLAIYDEATDKYLVGVELDSDAFASSKSSLERDVYKPKFLEARGWTIMRVWSRDIWLSTTKVVNSIIAVAEKNR